MEELRLVMPTVIGQLPLVQMWAYKYDQNAEQVRDPHLVLTTFTQSSPHPHSILTSSS